MPSKDERIFQVRLGEAPDAVVGQELVGVHDPPGHPPDLFLVQDRQGVGGLAVVLDGVDHVAGQLGAVLEEPVEVAPKTPRTA